MYDGTYDAIAVKAVQNILLEWKVIGTQNSNLV